MTAEPLEAVPDLTLPEAAARWGVASRNSIKARAAALGVELRRDSPTHTVWPAEAVALGDRLAEHLKQPGATLSNFPEALSVTAAGGVSDTTPAAPLAPSDRGKGPRRSALSVTPGAAVTDSTLGALLQLAAAMAPPPPPPDPLAVARGLAEAAQLGAWLSTAELAQLLGVGPGTVRSWHAHPERCRPGFELERRKDGAAVWWRVVVAPS